jgi:uncharacterized protein (TIGR03437 family)
MTNTRFLFLPLMIGAVAMAGFAQPNRISTRIDNTRTVILPGRVHPLATAANDVGAVDASLPLFLTLQLKPSAAQQAGVEQLLHQQQNPASASFHQWLTPEQYADQFGSSAGDTGQIAAWLASQGFTVDEVARSRTFVMFHGTAGQVQSAFGASLHQYRVDGVLHYANANNPTIPAALSGVVAGIRGLNDFHPKPQMHKTPLPQYTTGGPGTHYLAPGDFATLYDVTPMYTTGINGSGQSIIVVGQSALYGGTAATDITQFWSMFGITTAKLTQKLVSNNPGIVPGDVDEASLDVEWSSAVAPGATIVFVYSDDVWTSAEYAVDEKLGSVLSMSFGDCEMFDLTDLPTYRQYAQLANLEGITWLAAAGDSGAAGCDNPFTPQTLAEGGLAVEAPSSIPEVTSMGGSMFNEGSGSYWNTANSSTLESAKSYIPEVVWNETSLIYGLAAAGAGPSLYFPQPAWQTTAAGVPNDGWRHVPDLTFSAANHDGYYVLSGSNPTASQNVEIVSGTSCATPTMAGVVALLNQYALSNGTQKVSGLGNINPGIYALAQIALAQTTPGPFHDITTGNNDVPCAYGSPECSGATPGVAGTQGFSASGPGYSVASGFGSVDVTKFIEAWSSYVATGSLVVPSIDQNPVYQTTSGASGNQWSFNLTLNEEAGIATTLTGFTVSVSGNTTSYASQIVSLFGTAAIPARGSISASYTLSLATVPTNVTFGFSGMDAGGKTWTTALTVAFEGPQTNLAGGGFSSANAASGKQAFAPGMIMSVYGTGLGTLAQSATTIPLPEYMAGFQAYIGNYPVPLYYVGPNQVNLQIPYETAPGPNELTLYNPWVPNGLTSAFTVSATAPGIFTFANGTVNPSSTGSPGQVATLFITGEGQVTPSLADGTTPSVGTPVANLPKPRAAVSMTVGSIAVSTTAASNWFVGIPSGLVGVTQINFTIPSNVTPGLQPVVVTVGGVASPPAYITIQ